MIEFLKVYVQALRLANEVRILAMTKVKPTHRLAAGVLRTALRSIVCGMAAAFAFGLESVAPMVMLINALGAWEHYNQEKWIGRYGDQLKAELARMGSDDR